MIRFIPRLALIALLPWLAACMQTAGTDTPFGDPAAPADAARLTGAWVPAGDAPVRRAEWAVSPAGHPTLSLIDHAGTRHETEVKLTRFDSRRLLLFVRAEEGPWAIALLENTAEGPTLTVPAPAALRAAGLALTDADAASARLTDAPDTILAALRSPAGEAAIAQGLRTEWRRAAE